MGRSTLEVLAGLPWIGPEGYDPQWDDVDGAVGVVLHYSREGEPISLRTWSRLWSFSFEEYRCIAHTVVGSYLISTVWLGMDFSFGEREPLIFETMVFKHDAPAMSPPGVQQPEITDSTDLDMQQYATEEEAVAGHEMIVEKVRLIVEGTS